MRSSQKDNTTKPEKSKLRRVVPVVLSVMSLLYIAYLGITIFYPLDTIFKDEPKTATKTSLADLAQELEGSTGGKHIQASETNKAVVKPTNVKLVDVQSYDELANLYLLIRRVRNDNRDAATVYGLQRLSLASKREQLKEVSLTAQIEQHKFETQKSKTDSAIYALKEATPSQSNVDSDNAITVQSDLPSLGEMSSPDHYGGYDGRYISTENSIESKDVELKAVYKDRAFLSIKNNNYSRVKPGRTVMARFRLVQFTQGGECVEIVDERDEDLFTTCIN